MFIEFQTRTKPHGFPRRQCTTFRAKVDLATCTQKSEVSFWGIKPHHNSHIINWRCWTQNILFLFNSYVYQAIVVMKRDYSGTYFFRLIWRGVLIKHDKKRNYFKSKSMNLPKAIDIYHSVDHVMNIVILACRTCLFFHHLWINWIVRGRVRQGGMGDGTGNGSSAVCIPGTFWSQVDINLIREAPLAFCLLQTIKQHNCVCASLSNCSTITRIEN